MSLTAERTRKLQFGWVVLGLSLIACIIVAGVRAAPVEGTSDDRLFALAAQLKCETCIGESVAGSSSQFAVAARGEIKRQMQIGKSDDEILASFVEPYGEDVLLNPPNSGLASLVWILPSLAAGLAILGVGMAIRKWVARPDGEIDVSFEDADLVRTALAARFERSLDGSDDTTGSRDGRD